MVGLLAEQLRPVGVGDLGHVDIARESTAMPCGAMNCPGASPSGCVPSRASTSPCADKSETRGPRFGTPAVSVATVSAQFADDGQRGLPRSHRGRRGAFLVPLGLVFAVAVEHLHAMVLAVSDIDQAVVVAGDVVHEVELAGPVPGSPHENSGFPSGAYLCTRAFW